MGDTDGKHIRNMHGERPRGHMHRGHMHRRHMHRGHMHGIQAQGIYIPRDTYMGIYEWDMSTGNMHGGYKDTWEIHTWGKYASGK
jgi:hypothetical protein